MSANDMQVGGQHYATAAMQHWDFVHASGLGYHAGNATKYVDRFRKKNGAQDLSKAVHYCTKCHELGIAPPPEGQFLTVLMEYTEGRADICPRQRAILMQIGTGMYLDAVSAIEALQRSEYL